jgi:hypothetical protein
MASTPLLEEKGYASGDTLVLNLANPRGIHWPRLRPTFASDNDPVNAPQVEDQRLEQRFARKESNSRWYFLKNRDSPVCPELVFNRNTGPNILWPPVPVA